MRKANNFKLKMPLWYAPIQIFKDLKAKLKAKYQPLYGLRLYCGRQGYGKTYCMIHDVIELAIKYPDILVMSNMMIDYPFNHFIMIDNVADICNQDNRGLQGTIVVLDEVQNFLYAGDRAFPPELLSEITQQRKQHMSIFGTTQVFTRCSKELREQTYKVINPHTLLGCITFVRECNPFIKDGEIKDSFGIYKFYGVQSDDVRNAYNTLKKPNTLSRLHNYNTKLIK